MTPEERAGGIMGDLRFWKDMPRQLADAIRAAIAEECEACVQIAAEIADRNVDGEGVGRAIVAAIRARK